MENPADLDVSIPWVARGYSNTLQSKKYGRTIKDGETNFLLCAEDDVHLSTDLKTSTPVQKQAQQVRQRPKSASAAYSAYSRTTPPRPQSATVTGGWRKPRPLSAQRPSSGRPWKVPPGEDGKKRRAWSAGPRRPASAVSLNKKSFTLVSRAFEDERLMYEFSPHPNHRFLDRHARCFDHTHIHLQLLLTRPQTACRHCGEFRCPMGDCAYGTNSTVVSPGSRPRSAAGVRDPPETEYEQYIAYTRPARPSTAPPGGRRGLAEREPVTRGHIPHFCNFVQSAILHERDHSTEIHHHDHHHHHHQYSDVDIDRKDSSSQGHGGRRSARPFTEPEYVRPESPVVSEVEVKEEDDWDEKIDVTIVDKENEPEFQNDSEIRNITPPPIPHPPLHPPPKPCSVWMETPPVKKPVPPPLPKPVEKHKPVENPKRVCVKKEKRPVERERQKREMEPPEPVKAAEPEPPPPPPPPEPVEESKPQVKERPVVGPPDLPELKPAERPATPVKQPTPTPPKHPIQGGVDVVKVDPLELLDLEMKLRRREYEMMESNDQGFQRPKGQNWMSTRMALSKQASRFELPMDMKLLETMNPQDYLREYCKVSSKRTAIYKKFFDKHREKTFNVTFQKLDTVLNDVLAHPISKETFQDVCSLVQLDENTSIDYKLFAGIAALCERLLYTRFITEDTADMVEYQKERIECADFTALEWKFQGIQANPEVKKLLWSIAT